MLPFAADFRRLILSFHNASMQPARLLPNDPRVRNHPENGTRENTSEEKSVKLLEKKIQLQYM